MAYLLLGVLSIVTAFSYAIPPDSLPTNPTAIQYIALAYESDRRPDEVVASGQAPRLLFKALENRTANCSEAERQARIQTFGRLLRLALTQEAQRQVMGVSQMGLISGSPERDLIFLIEPTDTQQILGIKVLREILSYSMDTVAVKTAAQEMEATSAHLMNVALENGSLAGLSGSGVQHIFDAIDQLELLNLSYSRAALETVLTHPAGRKDDTRQRIARNAASLALARALTKDGHPLFFDQEILVGWMNRRQELDGLLEQLSSQRSSRTTGVVVGLSASSLAFVSGTVALFSEFAASLVASVGSTALGGPLVQLATDAPTLLFGASCASLLGSATWFVIKSTKVSTLKRKVRELRDRVAEVENQLRGKLLGAK